MTVTRRSVQHELLAKKEPTQKTILPLAYTEQLPKVSPLPKVTVIL